MAVDLRQEQQASLARPRLRYSLTARLFFFMMDLITGKKTTFAKAKLIEMLAGIPYRAWENRQYTRMTRHFRDQDLIREARRIAGWGREAQDNEYWHLLVIDEKMKEDGSKNPWYLTPMFSAFVIGLFQHPPGVSFQRGVRRSRRTRLCAVCGRSPGVGETAGP